MVKNPSGQKLTFSVSPTRHFLFQSNQVCSFCRTVPDSDWSSRRSLYWYPNPIAWSVSGTDPHLVPVLIRVWYQVMIRIPVRSTKIVILPVFSLQRLHTAEDPHLQARPAKRSFTLNRVWGCLNWGLNWAPLNLEKKLTNWLHHQSANKKIASLRPNPNFSLLPPPQFEGAV